MSTILSDKIGTRKIISETQLIGPLGGSGWHEVLLDDKTVVLIGEKTSSWRPMPKWLLLSYPKKIFSAAGSGNGWRAYISDMVIDGCVCHHCGKIYRIDFNVNDDMWQNIINNSDGSGMLCGSCICSKLEHFYKKHNKYGVFEIS